MGANTGVHNDSRAAFWGCYAGATHTPAIRTETPMPSLLTNNITSRLRQVPARINFRRRPPRDVMIAAAVIIVITSIAAIRATLPAITYWLTPAPSKHAGIVPDDASLFVSVDLLAARRQATAELWNGLNYHAATSDDPAAIVHRYTGLDWDQHRPDRWAGREMSLTVNADATYAIIIDINDRRRAARYLDTFLSDPPQNLSATLLPQYLVVASETDTAHAIIERIDNPIHNTLSQTADYRNAIASHDENRPLATVFLRWTLAQGKYSRSHAGLMGCHPGRWLSATVRVRDQRITGDAYCPPTEGVRPPATLTVEQARPKPADGGIPAFWLANSFTPDVKYITARTSDTGTPDYTLLDYIYGRIVAPTTAGIADIEAAVLQHLDGYISLAISPAAPGQPPSFRATLSVTPEGSGQLAETVDAVVSAMAGAYGIEAARRSGAGWRMRHPHLPNHSITAALNDHELTITGNAPDLADPALGTTALPPELPHPYQTAIYASAPYAADLLATAFPSSRTYTTAIAAFAYSAHNRGSVTRHRLHLIMKPFPPDTIPNP